MELRLPNYTLKQFKAHNELVLPIQTMLEKALHETLSFFEINTQERYAKAVVLSLDNHRYLVYQNRDCVEVYREDIHEYNQHTPFNYELKHMKQEEEIYATPILKFISVKNDDGVEKKELNREEASLLEHLKDMFKYSSKPAAIKKMILKLGGKIDSGINDMTSSPERAQEFIQDMTRLAFYSGPLLPDDFFEAIGIQASEYMQPYNDEIHLHFSYLNTQAKKQGFNSKNKFTFNDLDNHIFKHKEGFFMTSQNVSWLVVPLEGQKNWDVYASSYEFKRHKDEDSLTQALRQGTLERLKDVSLQMRNGVVTYCNPSDMYCFYLDMKYSAENIEQTYGVEMTFDDVDIKSYEYQSAYYAHHYQTDEAFFVASAVMGLGTGFDYHEEKGVFYDSGVSFIHGLKEVEISKIEQSKIEQIMPIYPEKLEKITYINEQWEDAFRRFAQAVIEQKPSCIYPEDNGEALQAAALRMIEIADENAKQRKKNKAKIK